MRNLKKILALVLALVMSFSLMATANAFTDSDKIDNTYEEAVEVLSGLKVFQGYTDGSFQPQGKITRAEVAAIIYRIVTGDVADKQVGIYADYGKFSDVDKNAWYAGYVNFCANAEIIKGYSATKFGPNDSVTGYQALAMILRAIGYDKNGEFTGSGWQVQTAAVGKKLHVTDNVTEGTLNTAATREVVAEILFQTLLVPQVEYTVAFGYQSYGKNSLGTDTFKLVKGSRTTIDNWGRPGYQWFAYNSRAVVATIDEPYLYETHIATTECDIAKAIGQGGTKTYALYDNDSDTLSKKSINALSQAAVGAQGQIVEVYKDRIVVIDTLLAQVVGVADATYDRNGHLASPSKITLDVYQADTDAANASSNNNTVRVVATNGATNYTYAVGSYVLVNAHLNNDAVIRDWQNAVEYMEILGVADSMDGVQTVIWYNAGQHTVNGTTYDDADRFHLNVNTKSAANRTWFFDQFGNLIGDVEIATQYSYAVIKNLWWAGDVTTGGGSAKATLVYMDGSENTVTVSSISAWNAPAGGTASLVRYIPVYSGYNNTTSDMTVGTINSANVLYVASNAYANAVATADNARGIIGGNLFRVSTGVNDTVVLDEVADELTAANIISRYALVTGTGAKHAAGDNSVLVNANTQFLLYNTAAGKFETYAGFNAIPNFRNNAVVVDYVEDGTGYAKYVYLIGQPDTTVTYNFVMPLSVNYSAQLLTTGGVSYYVVTIVNVGGEQTTLKVRVADAFSGANVIGTLTATANTNKLYYVTFTGEYATSLVEITGVNQSAATAAPNTLVGLPANVNATKIVDNAAAQAITRTGNDLWYSDATNNFHFNITDATEIVGTLPEGGRLTAKTVYVLHDPNTNVVSKIWIVDNGSSVVGPVAPQITGLTVTVNTGVGIGNYVKDLKFTATATNSNVAGQLSFGGTVTAAPVWQKLNETTGVYENYAGDAFVAGTYRAVVNLTVNNVAGQYYTIAANAPISYYGQAGKTGASFITDPIVVPAT